MSITNYYVIYFVLANFIALLVFQSIYIHKYSNEKDKQNKVITLSVLLGVSTILGGFFFYDEFIRFEKIIGNPELYARVGSRIGRQFGFYIEKNKALQAKIKDFLFGSLEKQILT